MTKTKTQYNTDQKLALIVRPDQKAWLKAQASGYRSMSDILRDLIDKAMQES